MPYYGYEDLPRGRLYTSGIGEGLLSRLLNIVPESWMGYAGYERLPEEEFYRRHLVDIPAYRESGGFYPTTRGDIRNIPGGIDPRMVEPSLETMLQAARMRPFYDPYISFRRGRLD
ncbi:MAG: hypothetical protein GTN80_08205 [Nitrososphaeria archaeon]|nr:hypothetical protein [Nitrososphaeria archaeon]NIQ33605.1 hypothetical protein [Nitrososphaeria archaeon]